MLHIDQSHKTFCAHTINPNLSILFSISQLFADKMFGVMAWIIPVFVACSTFGAANGSALSSGRYCYTLSYPTHNNSRRIGNKKSVYVINFEFLILQKMYFQNDFANTMSSMRSFARRCGHSCYP